VAPGLVALGRVALDLVVLPKGLRPALGQAHVLLALVAHAGQRLDRVALDLVGPVGPVALAGLAGLAGAANLVLVCPVVHVGMAPCPRNQLGRPSDKALALRQNTEYRPRLEARGRGQRAGQTYVMGRSWTGWKIMRQSSQQGKGSWAPWRSLVVQRNHRLKVLVGGLPRTMTIGGVNVVRGSCTKLKPSEALPKRGSLFGRCCHKTWTSQSWRCSKLRHL